MQEGPAPTAKTESANKGAVTKKGAAAAADGSGAVAAKKAPPASKKAADAAGRQEASPGTTGAAAAAKKKVATRDDKAIEAKTQKGAGRYIFSSDNPFQKTFGNVPCSCRSEKRRRGDRAEAAATSVAVASRSSR